MALILLTCDLTQHVFSVWPVARPVVGEMEMHSVANLATLQTPLETFPFKKAPKPSFWESPALPRQREVLPPSDWQRGAALLIQLNTDIMLLL